MNDNTIDEKPPGGLALGDIYFVLFRWKWLILLFSLAGLLAAVAIMLMKPALYQSQATLNIRYIEEGKSPKPPGDELNTRALNEQEAAIINTETLIVLSQDVAQQAALAVGPERILARKGGGTNSNQAAGVIQQNLQVDLPAKGSVISIFFRHPDPEVAQEVLHQVIVAYVKKHAVMHQTVGIFAGFLTNETARLRAELAQTEQQLREAKSKAGVATSVEDAIRDYAEQISKIREDRNRAEVELAQHEARLKGVGKQVPVKSGNTNMAAEIPPETINKYKNICVRLADLWRTNEELLRTYREETLPVKNNRQRIADTEKLKSQLESEFPRLATLVGLTPGGTGQSSVTSMDPATEEIQINALKSGIEELKSQLSEIQSNAAKADEMEVTILGLQRKKEVVEANLKYFSTRLEQARSEQAFGDGKASNIATIDGATPAEKKWTKPFKKKVQSVAIGGFLGGVALAFLIELFLDRSVKRPVDVERKLRLPLLISIPDIDRNGNRRHAKAITGRGPLRLAEANGDVASKDSVDKKRVMQVVAWDRGHLLKRFYEGLRDRLIVYFEVRNLDQKPKLLGVTSCGQGVGVSTIATGLAASLSETGDGNVLLVDMNSEQGASQEFYKGKPGCRLDDAVTTETMDSALVRADAQAGDERVDGDKLPRLLPARFAGLMPKLNARHYDYIVFDLPPVSQTSLTPRLVRIMDMVLLVIESEKTNQDVVKQATDLLAESKANIGAVLNKTHTYVPAWLHQELNDA